MTATLVFSIRDGGDEKRSAKRGHLPAKSVRGHVAGKAERLNNVPTTWRVATDRWLDRRQRARYFEQNRGVGGIAAVCSARPPLWPQLAGAAARIEVIQVLIQREADPGQEQSAARHRTTGR